jgi:5'-deoxynucleotidase YfbR-like HD superfamily hydrolase
MLKIPNEFSIQTMNNFFDYENPTSSTMTIEDIALSLSNICRWGGHCRPFFSVAAHALEVSAIAYSLAEKEGETPEECNYIAYVALHHDDHEAVRGDIPSPRKRYLKKHNQLFKGEELGQDEYIYSQLLGLNWPFDDKTMDYVKRADWIALMTERQFLKPIAEWSDKEPAKATDALDEKFFSFYLKNRNWEKLYLDCHNNLKDAF